MLLWIFLFQLVDEFLSSQGPSCNLASSYQIDDYYNFGNDERNNMMSNPFNYDYDSSESQVNSYLIQDKWITGFQNENVRACEDYLNLAYNY